MAASRLLVLGLSFALGSLIAAPAHAADSFPWTTTGSCGTVDEADLSVVSISGPYLTTTGAAAAGTVVDVRYNVVDLAGLHNWDNCRLKVRYRDNGADARVIVRLKSYNFDNGNLITLMTFDSNAFAANGAYQSKFVDSGCWPGWTFDFDRNAYFLEVEVQKNGIGGLPGIAGIQIIGTMC